MSDLESAGNAGVVKNIRRVTHQHFPGQHTVENFDGADSEQIKLHIELVIVRAHGSRSAIKSSATPSGDDARPRESRINARLIISTGTPYCKAIEQTTAESFCGGVAVAARFIIAQENFREPPVGKSRE
jgi:hypothetical protein